MPSIAVLGASADRRKFGNRCVRAYLQQGYRVFPINPRETTIEGLVTYPSLREIPLDYIDLVSVYLPPQIMLQVFDQLTAKSFGEVLFNPGADDPEVLDKARKLGLNVVTGCSIVMLGMSPHDLDS